MIVTRIYRQTYIDSVSLMGATAEIQVIPGVRAAALVMATDQNRELLASAGLLAPELASARPDDVVLVVRADSAEVGEAALRRAQELLAARGGDQEAGAMPRPRSMLSAARRVPGANIAIISLPGRYAVAEAHQALSAGLHVFLFSDGVSFDDEVALKRRARERGLLFMGPECGTAILNGIGLGFANRVRRGPVGLIGASGTGLQEVCCLIHRLGSGVSQAIGTGGRDLSEAVGGLMTLEALVWLRDDPRTSVMVLISKPPSKPVAERILDAAAAARKPIVAFLVGWRGRTPAGVRLASSLEEAARLSVEAVGVSGPGFDIPEVLRPGHRRPGSVLGLFTGGTLCDEARMIVGGDGHRFIDFGASEYTRGRPHPMIDPGLRNAAVARAGDDPSVTVLLVDLVLGYCAHPDPAGALVGPAREAIESAERSGRSLQIVAHVVGTDEDPQRIEAQEAVLRKLGAIVCPTNRLAALSALDLSLGDHAA